MLRQTERRAFLINTTRVEFTCLRTFRSASHGNVDSRTMRPHQVAAKVDLLIAVGLGAHEQVLRAHTGPVLVVLESESDDDICRPRWTWPTTWYCSGSRRRGPVPHTTVVRPPYNDAESVSDHISEELGINELVGEAPVFKQVVRQVHAMSRSDSPVLITGETGTGKEMCARAIHHLSRRRNLPFIPIDCGSIPAHLFENEVFGHSRGAFTDAQADQKGLVAMADGGNFSRRGG